MLALCSGAARHTGGSLQQQRHQLCSSSHNQAPSALVLGGVEIRQERIHSHFKASATCLLGITLLLLLLAPAAAQSPRLQEIATLAGCRSPFITRYHGSLVPPGSSQLLIVMELLLGSVADAVSTRKSMLLLQQLLPQTCLVYVTSVV
jgi:hypothetical protein